MDDTNNHRDLKSVDGRDRSTPTSAKEVSSDEAKTIYAGLNEVLQELADSGQPLFITPLGPPDSEGNTPIKWECNASPITLKFDVLTEGPDAIPLDGKQTVDHLVINTNNLDRKYNLTSSRGYVFNVVCGRLSLLKQVRMEDVIEARNRLGLSTALLESIGMPLYSVEFKAGSPRAKAQSTNQKEQAKPGTTVVHAERVVVDNKKMIKILKFEDVQLLSNLPNKYTASQPIYCWFRSGIELKYYDHPHTIHQNVLPGDTLSLKEFGQMIKTMKEAAARLSKINKTAKLEREHSGKFTVSICPAKTNSSGCLQVTSGMLHIVQFSKNVSTSNILENTKETHII